MAIVKMSDTVNVTAPQHGALPEGLEPGHYVLRDLADRGFIEFHRVDHFGSRDGTAFFADIKGTSYGWQIRQTAYNSRMGIKNDFTPKPRKEKKPSYGASFLRPGWY